MVPDGRHGAAPDRRRGHEREGAEVRPRLAAGAGQALAPADDVRERLGQADEEDAAAALPDREEGRGHGGRVRGDQRQGGPGPGAGLADVRGAGGGGGGGGSRGGEKRGPRGASCPPPWGRGEGRARGV